MELIGNMSASKDPAEFDIENIQYYEVTMPTFPRVRPVTPLDIISCRSSFWGEVLCKKIVVVIQCFPASDDKTLSLLPDKEFEFKAEDGSTGRLTIGPRKESETSPDKVLTQFELTHVPMGGNNSQPIKGVFLAFKKWTSTLAMTTTPKEEQKAVQQYVQQYLQWVRTACMDPEALGGPVGGDKIVAVVSGPYMTILAEAANAYYYLIGKGFQRPARAMVGDGVAPQPKAVQSSPVAAKPK